MKLETGHIRKAAVNDISDLEMLYKELIPDGPINILPERIEDISNDTNNFLYVYETEGKIVGTIFWAISKDPAFGFQPFATIENFIVTKPYRGRGIGKALILFMENQCRECHCTKVEFLCSMHRTDSHKFYEHMGYRSDISKGFKKYLDKHEVEVK